MKFLLSAVALAAGAHNQACEAANLMDSIAALPNAQVFTKILRASGLSTVLSDPSATSTVFVPTDDVYAREWRGYQIGYVLNNSVSSQRFSRYAIHPGSLTTGDMAAPANISTLASNHTLLVTMASTTGASLQDETCGAGETTTANQVADNGIFHLVDTILQPPAAICPDKIFVAEQRSDARISSYGYECRSRNETRHLYITDNQKPLGVTTDDRAQVVFWANDQDYPRRSPTSWISRISYNETDYDIVNNSLIDPQGVAADPINKKLYFASHSGYEIARLNYDGAGYSTVFGMPGNLSFQPSDVAVDPYEQRIFASVEGIDTLSGSLWSVFANGSHATQLLPNENATAGLIQNYGLCLDTYAKQVFWVQGGNGGSIHCFAYGDVPCIQELVVDGLNYPYMCDVDNSFAPYGGPTRIAWTEANRPGTVYYSFVNGSDETAVNVTVATDLDAPMGISFGCSPF